eukprot:CAMPEP_0116141498 /NCGR_PEP_ID=MMETSP0329-20121206/14414_1 /TAXON_ID=697910 /ORGANISM="Pseudo-nitzschia arenysensis, Strain B593" /LENGTH=431 /DNA_ID=CAMNT_0003636685 /DNA_START=73 /DNA_END=1368 /DNA_ORIENTATION=-
MAINKRFAKFREDEEIALVAGGGARDDKLQKERSQNDSRHRKMGLLFALLAVPLFVKMLYMEDSVSVVGMKGSVVKKKEEYELYPFLVNSKDVEASGTAALSKITLPEFPVIERLEGCKLSYKPSDPPRTTKTEWRKMFWVPSFPGSGASTPTGQGDLVRKIIEGLFSGDEGNARGKYFNPVKSYHMSIKNQLKRCRGVSETVGCQSSHPLSPNDPTAKGKDKEFRPDMILPIRNPASAIPTFYVYKHIAYHDGTKQDSEDKWRGMRDNYALSTFEQWMGIVKFWRGTAEESSYYYTAAYIPFEDLMSTDPSKGIAAIKALSDALSGRKVENGQDGDFFETSSSEEDYECLWYRAAKGEWERQKPIFGDYIPAYTQEQKDKMVSELKAYADEVEKDPFRGEQDTILVSILRRYARQIEQYVLVEETRAPTR